MEAVVVEMEVMEVEVVEVASVKVQVVRAEAETEGERTGAVRREAEKEARVYDRSSSDFPRFYPPLFFQLSSSFFLLSYILLSSASSL